MKANRMSLVALGIALATACSQHNPNYMDPAYHDRAMVTGQMVRQDFTPAQRQRVAKVLGALTVLNKNEIAAARLAEQRAVNPEVKRYAVLLDKHHSNSLNRTMQLGHLLDVVPNARGEIAQMLGTKGKRQLTALEHTKEAAFDKAYIGDMVKGHENALKLVDKMYAQTANPVMRQDLERVRQSVALHLEKGRVVMSHL